ncbi:unnamed protein product [Didymodactylos carnosus]|uniref:Angiotensin-converting enzyme n=1 Tax=Didymodactylos carnosus TaxID=1234261 RepID=A0A814Y2C4_9BILA|nr:unnamed protein product [Didymodactylos carnosus]CAF1223487.1 unnamed protein product [Didymodactylos carnosus]CAF3791195.1 unnamed protein product [Didymodactylos carnosus]CAF3986713.1 unnamed protein product [Didymodactylos carnosus]
MTTLIIRLLRYDLVIFFVLLQLNVLYGSQYNDKKRISLNYLLEKRFHFSLSKKVDLLYETGDDFDEINGEIDIDLLNSLNEIDLNHMPVIDDYSDNDQALEWLNWYTKIERRYMQISALLSWNYETNITQENEEKQIKQKLITTPFSRQTLPIIKKFNKYMKYSTDYDLKRIYGLAALGTVVKDDRDVEKGSQLHSQMDSIYSTATVCELKDPNECYQLTPMLENLMHVEKDYDRLLWAWKGWHDECGNKIRPIYLDYINLLTKNIQENGYQDLAESWIEDYEIKHGFEDMLDQLLLDILPLYKQIHAYMRGKLCKKYPNRFDCNGPIPAHLLGNMWAQQWHDRLDDVLPYPENPLANITKILLDRKVTIHQMYLLAENFFTSINLDSMTKTFWSKSMFEKPNDRAAICHASASDMANTNDYRVKICTEINDDNLYTVHHEMGHVEYYMAYDKTQPIVYRTGANSAFHEAIGDTIGMFVLSPTHQATLGFIDKTIINEKYEMNFLMRMALQKVAFLPFAYIMDKYRFALFRNEIDVSKLNSVWWDMRLKYGGLMPPVERSEQNFDPGAKYHIPSNVPYTRYFLAHILQFQFHRALCKIGRNEQPLHLCDIYKQKSVGNRFYQMLAAGNSRHWSEILETLTGENTFQSQAILDYFQPLYKWIKQENIRLGYPVGW